MTELAQTECLSSMQIDLYLDGRLDDAPVVAHLQNCSNCSANVQEQQSNNALLQQLTDSMADSNWRNAPDQTGAVPDCAIDGYEILHEIRRGAQGVVFEAMQLSANRRVALKLLLSGAFATSAQRRRFEREIELVAGLDHPGIVTVYDSGLTASGQLYFAMQYVDGVTLDQWTADVLKAKGRQSRRELLHRLLNVHIRICEAVHHAHLHGVIHRDLKPGNILIDENDQPHVLDFGLAKPMDPAMIRASHTVTQAGQFMGTIAFAAPEQTRGDPTLLDVRTDVYALGVMLYEMITGRLPIEPDADLRQTLRAIVEQSPAPPSDQNFHALPINRDLDTIVLKALTKDQPRRYQSAQALHDDVVHFLRGEPINARRDSSVYVIRKFIARHQIGLSVIALFLVILVGFSISMSVLYRRATIEADKVKQINLFLEDTLGSVEPLTPGQAVTVREMLDEAAQWIDIALRDQPEVQAAIHTTLGNGYRALELYDRSNHHLNESLRIRRDLFGNHDDQVAQSLNALALLRHDERQFNEAIQLFHESLQMRERILGAKSYEVSLTHANLSRAYRDAGNLSEAEHHVRLSLDIRRSLFGNAHQDVAMCLHSLGVLAETRGASDDALQLYEQAFDIRQQVLHQDHPDLERSQAAIGAALLDLKRADEAMVWLQDSIEARMSHLGPAHWRVAEARYTMARALIELGRSGEANALLESAVAQLTSALGDHDPRVRRAAELLEQTTNARNDELTGSDGLSPGQ